MRLGGPVKDIVDLEDWIAKLKERGYRAAYCPIGPGDDAQAELLTALAGEHDIMIGEVGAFGNNPISPDADIRHTGIVNTQERLALADQVGARCCVNVSGSRGERWAGPHPDNLTGETFDLIVASVREIIDGVNPTRASFTIETMPWLYPDSIDSYLDLIAAVDRPEFGVHFDLVNLINCPGRYYRNTRYIRECVEKLGPHIRSCHLKDIILEDELTVHLNEVRAGLGGIDFATLLTEIEKLDPDMPVMLEHLPSDEEYRLAADHVRKVAGEVGATL